MPFNPRNAVKKERKFNGRIFRLQDRLTNATSEKIMREAYRLKQQGWLVRTILTKDEYGYYVVDIYIRRKE